MKIMIVTKNKRDSRVQRLIGAIGINTAIVVSPADPRQAIDEDPQEYGYDAIISITATDKLGLEL